jgi:hypothetical protein
MLAVSGLISGWIGMAEGQLPGPKATVTSPGGVDDVDLAQ